MYSRTHVLCLVNDMCTESMVDPILGVKTFKTGVDRFDLKYKCDIKIYNEQKLLYSRFLSNASIVKIIPDNDRGDGAVQVVAKEFIKKNTKITELGATHYPISDLFLKDNPSVNNISSLVRCELNKRNKIFLGPCSFMDHDSEPNTEWVSVSKSSSHVKTIRDVERGERLTLFLHTQDVTKTHDCDDGNHNTVLECNNSAAAAAADMNVERNIEFASFQSTTVRTATSEDVTLTSRIDTKTLDGCDDTTTAVPFAEKDKNPSENRGGSATDVEKTIDYFCDYCKLQFRYKSLFKRHMTTHDPPSHQCELCFKLFKRRDNVEIHKLIVHRTQALFECAICGSKFKHKDSLKVHIKQRHFIGQNVILNKKIYIPPRYSCSQCKKKFSNSKNLVYHENAIHSKKTPFACKDCPKMFSAPNRLYTHRKKFHQNGDVVAVIK